MDDAALTSMLGLFPVIAAAVAGAVFASYGGVLAERGLRASIAGRSRCVCGRTLAWWENIPVLSWVALRGRARCCRTTIPVRYVLTEVGGGALGAGLGAGAGWFGVALAAVAGVGVALAGSRNVRRR
jgi:prepilin signal peptidase PulO-like enzyme (type II secretory pathway)